MRNIKKLISLLLVFSMVFSFVPMAYADSTLANGNGEFIDLSKISESIADIDIQELTYEQGINARKSFDFENYGLVRKSLKDVLSNRAGSKSGLSDDEKKYVEDVVTALSKPIGAIDLDGLNPNEKIDIIVWLQQLPTALKEAYGEVSAMRLSSSYEDLGAQAREAIKSQYGFKSHYANKGNVSSAINYEYSVVFSGFAMTVSVKEAKEIAAMPGVYAVNPDTIMYANATNYDPTYKYTGMLESREIFNMSDIHGAGITGEGVVVGVLDTGIDYNHPDLENVYKGGWNYILPTADHGRPAELQNDPMETTYEQWLASGQPETNANGSEFYTDHGTHVSGTIAARPENTASENYRALGMAPDVELYVARVLGPYGSGATAGIIAAVEDFTVGNIAKNIKKADVINLSLGANTNTAYGDNVYALNNAVIAGVNVAVSAGNNATGPNSSAMKDRKIQTLGTPGTAYLPVTVAAAQYGGSTTKTYDNVTAISTSGSAIDAPVVTTGAAFGLLLEGQNPSNIFTYNIIEGNPSPKFIEGKGYELYLGYNQETNVSLLEDDFIRKFIGEPIKDEKGNVTDYDKNPALRDSLKDKILVVKRGISFVHYQAAALHTGAGALIIVNNAANGEKYITNMVIGGTSVGSLPIFSAYHSTSAKLTELAGEENTVYLQLGDITEKEHLKYPAYFSSIGPVNPTIGLKPDIIAPGWQIVSTAPAFITDPDHAPENYNGAYQSMGGTSMSAPHIAGILALMKQQYPDATPAEIKARLMNTANYDDFMKTTDDTNEYDASVLEIGAGFVNPYRALIEEKIKNIYVTVTDDIPGQTNGSVMKDQTLSSLSFGKIDSGNSSRELPIEVHGTSTFSIDVVYNNNTRYSEDASDNIVLEWSNPENGKFKAWIEASIDAEDGYYEGWLVITADSKEYVLPWLVQLGVEKVPEFKNLEFTSERPIISTSADANIRSAGAAAPVNSNSTSLWFTWEGAWPTDSYGYSDLDFYLVKPENIGDDSIIPDYYYGYDTIDGMVNDGQSVFLIPNFIADKAYKMENGSIVSQSKEIIANGAYNLAILAGDEFYIIDEIGVVYTDGIGDYAVQLTLNENIYADPDSGVTTAQVRGNIYSPALEEAADAGFVWTAANDYWGKGVYYEIDQSFNILGYKTNDPILISSAYAYNLFLDNGNPWICDINGNFNITRTLTAEQKDGGYVFDLGGNHEVVGVEGFYFNNNDSNPIPFIGANKSASVEPRYTTVEPVTEYEVTFNLNGGNIGGNTENIVVTVEEGSTVEAPANPVRANYSFIGWFEEGEETTFNFTTPITRNLTLTARYTYVVIDDGGNGGGNTGGTTPTPTPTPTPEPTPEPESVVFNDTANHWAKDDIAFISGLGLVNGTGDGEFSPNALMNRGMIVTILARLAKIDANNYNNSSSFNDVSGNKYYAPFVEWAAQFGIVSGTSNGKFDPESPLTKEQLAHILMNYAKKMNLSFKEGTGNSNQFADANKISSYAKDSVELAKNLGIITGNPDGTFDPQKSITRAEVITMLARFIRVIEE